MTCKNQGGGHPCPECGGYHSGPMPDPFPKSDNVGAAPGRLTMSVALTTEGEGGKQTTTTIEFTVAEQRAIVERETGEKCFRMWLSDDEHNKVHDMVDWTCYRLSDGRWAVWRKESDLKQLRDHGAITVLNHIEGRRLGDEVE